MGTYFNNFSTSRSSSLAATGAATGAGVALADSDFGKYDGKTAPPIARDKVAKAIL